MALAAALEALNESGLLAPPRDDLDPPFLLAPELARDRVGVAIGTTLGEPNFLERMSTAPLVADSRWAQVTGFPASAIAEGLATVLTLAGPVITLPTACAAGNYAVADALELLRSGAAQVMLAGGADAFSRSAYLGFARLHAMSPDACRPFDRERKGLLLGEGAGILVLERAFHITGPHPEGRGAARVMAGALADAELGSDVVDYINAHGTGTLHNDRTESLAIRTVFGRAAERVPVSSIKALTGHTMGAAGAIESVASILALRHQTIPPTWNFETPDPDCPLDVVPNAPRAANLRTVLNNSYAFGGNNASILFGHADVG
jgi:3-oxoacyl-[acyl-carrier-protein] synthase II